MSEHPIISTLIDQVLAELERLQYAENSRAGYRRFYTRVLHFAQAQGVTHYYLVNNFSKQPTIVDGENLSPTPHANCDIRCAASPR